MFPFPLPVLLHPHNTLQIHGVSLLLLYKLFHITCPIILPVVTAFLLTTLDWVTYLVSCPWMQWTLPPGSHQPCKVFISGRIPLIWTHLRCHANRCCRYAGLLTCDCCDYVSSTSLSTWKAVSTGRCSATKALSGIALSLSDTAWKWDVGVSP